MVCLENIINKLIELDNMAKLKINGIKEKEENIETYISERIEREQKIIDSQFAYKKKNLQEKYDMRLKEEIAKIDEKKELKIRELQNRYAQEKEKILNDLLKEII